MKKVIFLIILLASSINAKVKIVHNVKGYTINNSELTTFQAIAHEKGKILEIGDSKQLLNKYPRAVLTNGFGQTMLPGFHDASIDLKYASLISNGIDLTNTKSLEEVLIKLKKYKKENPLSQAIVGYGWNHNKWKNKKLPNKKDIDRLHINKFIWLISENRRIGWANSLFMEQANTKNANKKKYKNHIGYDSNGKQTGIFYDSALKIIQSHIVPLDYSALKKAFIDNLQTLSRFGITSVENSSTDTKTLKILANLASSHKLPIRLNAILSSADPGFENMVDNGAYHDEYNFLHAHSIKFFLDYGFIDQSALLKKPYSNSKNMGNLLQAKDFVLKKTIELSENNWSINIQANGDKANEMAIDILSNKNLNTKQIRHRINAATLIDIRDINKIKNSGIYASIIPNQAIEDMTIMQELIGNKRAKASNPWKTLINKGVKLTSGSKFPSNDPNPFAGIQSMVTRKNSKVSNKIWNKSQRLTVEQGLASYTINAAYATRQEIYLGSLEKGKWADFILVDQDIFKVKTKYISGTKVLKTWVAGKLIYNQANDFNLKKQ